MNKDKVLQLLEENARYSYEEMGVMLGIPADEVEKIGAQLEKEGIIRGYKVIVDRDKLKENVVSAIIELKVTPKRDLGFDEIAEKITQYPEVEDLYLMSGGYDLALLISCETFKDIAMFVAQRLATLDSVLSTATHFVLCRYKEKGLDVHFSQTDERRNVWY